jgi:hypothetical protein
MSERLEVMDALQRVLRAQIVNRDTKERPAPGRPSTLPLNKVFDVVSHHLGMSRETLRKAAAVRDAARRDPDRYGALFEQIDRTGKVDAAFRELCRIDGLGQKSARKLGLRKQLRFDALLSLPLTIARQRLSEYERAAAALRMLIASAPVPKSQLPIGEVVSSGCIAAARAAFSDGLHSSSEHTSQSVCPS